MLRHFRHGVELPEINRDDFYDFNFQEMRHLRSHSVVLPGDDLVHTCFYDTRNYTEAVVNGFELNEEMCSGYIHFYPAVDLDTCKSSISDQTITDFFEFISS